MARRRALGLLVALALPGVCLAELTAFGPEAVTGQGRWTIASEPGLRYALEIAWPGDPDAATPPVSVRLDGHPLMRDRTPARSRRVLESVAPRPRSTLEVVLGSGATGSVTVALRAWPASLPPDPGPAAQATLEGVDADGDGLRDEVHRYIEHEHPGSARLRLALTSYARALQDALAEPDDRRRAIEHAHRMSRLIDCVHGLVGYRARDVNRRLVARVADTPARARAYARFRRQIAGETFVVTPLKAWKAACPFDPDQVAD